MAVFINGTALKTMVDLVTQHEKKLGDAKEESEVQDDLITDTMVGNIGLVPGDGKNLDNTDSVESLEKLITE